MSAREHTTASRRGDEDDDRKRLAPDADDVLADDVQDGRTPALPDLNTGPLEPAAWLALQQTLGNRAVGGLVEQRRAGQPLPTKTRHEMEASFGRDFGQVQVYSGPEVDQAAQAIDAGAFTVGDDIYWHSDLPGVDDPFGRAVLGEELAHVAQGVGRQGVGRITDPAETGEREAHTAGLAAAEGKHANVGVDYGAENALARRGIEDLIAHAAMEAAEQAGAAAVPAQLTDEEKVRLAAGALSPLVALWEQLGVKLMDAKGGKPSAKALTAIVLSAEGISTFIFSFTGPAAVQPTIEAAATSALRGRQALFAAIDPILTTKRSAGILSAIAGEIDALATPPQPTGAPPPSGAPGAAPADALTAAEADQLRLGSAQPLRNAAAQLEEDEPDLDVILAIIKGVPSLLRSFSKPAALVPQLHRKALDVAGQIARLEAVRAGPEAAINMTMAEWQISIGLLQGLTAKTSASTSIGETAPSGEDEDKPQGKTAPGP